MLTLYYFRGAASIAAHILLEASGEPYALQHIDIPQGEHREPAYLRVHPLGRVPCLRLDDGRPLTENTAILPYLGQRFGWWPTDPLQQARTLEWIGFLATNVHPAFAHFNRPQRFADDPAARAEIKRVGLATFHEHLRQIDARLRGRAWCLDAYGVVDPYALLFFVWGLKRGLPVHEFRHYRAFIDRMAQRPEVQRVAAAEGVALTPDAPALPASPRPPAPPTP